jgi:hypothetical protein
VLYLRVVGDAVALGNIFGAPIEEVRFARDSPLEGDGFEPSVPQEIRSPFDKAVPFPMTV